MYNKEIFDNYTLKFNYILIEFQNSFKNIKFDNYNKILNNEDIVSSLFVNVAKDLKEYSDIYDVNIKLIDDIKILSFLAMNIYKIIEKDVSFRKKYYVFYIMLYRFEQHLPSKNIKKHKLLIKLHYMFKNLSSYNDLIKINGKFGIFQILKAIYNCETNNISFTSIEFDKNYKSTNKNLENLENMNGEISIEDWDVSDSIQV
jgi:hypothetical protein